MVADVVDRGRGNESVAHQMLHWRLTVEGMAASEAQDSRVPARIGG